MINEHPRVNQWTFPSFHLSAWGCDYQRVLRCMTAVPRGLNSISSLRLFFLVELIVNIGPNTWYLVSQLVSLLSPPNSNK